jgi:hypothetical protein
MSAGATPRVESVRPSRADLARVSGLDIAPLTGVDSAKLTAINLVDRAVAIARGVSWSELARAIAPALLLSWLALALYFFERVEGVRSLRPFFAIAFVLGYVLRAVVLARFAGRRVDELLAEHGLHTAHGDAASIVRTSLWIGFDLWTWLWLLVLALRIDPWLVPVIVPALSLRALLAPSWLADADAEDHVSGVHVLRKALDGGEGYRLTALAAELVLLLGAIGIALNLGSLAVAAVALGQELFGLDIAFVRSFVSPRNELALLVIAVLSLSAVDPLRPIIAALIHTETRLTRDGELVRSLVERCVERSLPLLGAALAFVAALSAASVSAQEEPVTSIVFEEEIIECDATCQRAHDEDAEIASLVGAILGEPRFREFPHDGWSPLGEDGLSVSSWIERVMRWLENLDDKPATKPGLTPLSLPGPVTFAVLMAIVVAFVAASLWLNRPKPLLASSAKEAEPPDPLQKDVDAHLHDAEQLAQHDLRSALRALYFAALVGLSRGGFITIMAERTNGQYLRELRSLEMKGSFAALTQIFEHVFYGQRAPTREDYERCLVLLRALREGTSP